MPAPVAPSVVETKNLFGSVFSRFGNFVPIFFFSINDSILICKFYLRLTVWTVNDLQGGLSTFCEGSSPGKTPQISIYSFWGVFPGEMPP